MSQLMAWLQDHRSQLADILTLRLGEFEAIQGRHTATAFLNALIITAEQGDTEPLYRIIDEWITTSSDAQMHLMALLTMQSDLHRYFLSRADPDIAAKLVIAFDTIFTLAISYLSQQAKQSEHAQYQDILERRLAEFHRLDKHKSDFISVAAHELKTPLTLIEGYAKILRADLPAEDYPQAAKLLRGIMNGALRLREIVEDMIDVSLIDMEGVDLNLQPVWLAQLLEMVITELRTPAEERHITITLEPDGFPKGAVMADPERLFQVFVKLVENGIKYTPDEGTITISGQTHPDMAEIMIRDTGIGINPEDQDMIFEKFFSLGQVGLHSTSKSKFKGGGPGLGLAIAKGIIQAHGGKIWVESDGYDETKLAGSCFHVMLPLHKVDQATIDELAQSHLQSESQDR
jgi:signal transduction histidine kinase